MLSPMNTPCRGAPLPARFRAKSAVLPGEQKWKGSGEQKWKISEGIVVGVE